MQLDDKAILAAVGEVLAEERSARVKLDAKVTELIDAYGNVIRTPGPIGATGERGTPGERGPVGDPGPRGLAGDIGQAGPAGAPGAPGEQGAPGQPAYPGRACGLWNATEAYREMDVVTFNGSEWRATRNDPGTLPGDGWVLGAKGSRGKPGDRGPIGPKGDQGPAGPAIDGLILADDELVLTREDGRALSVDLGALREGRS